MSGGSSGCCAAALYSGVTNRGTVDIFYSSPHNKNKQKQLQLFFVSVLSCQNANVYRRVGDHWTQCRASCSLRTVLLSSSTRLPSFPRCRAFVASRSIAASLTHTSRSRATPSNYTHTALDPAARHARRRPEVRHRFGHLPRSAH